MRFLPSQRLYAVAVRSFSMIEILMVLAIMSIVMGISIGTFSGIAESTALNDAAIIVLSKLDQARQVALTKHMYTEVRFYRSTEAKGRTAEHFIAIQTVEIDEVTGYRKGVIGKTEYLQNVVIYNEATYSELLSKLDDFTSETIYPSGETVDAFLPGKIPASFKKFRFSPSGAASFDELTEEDLEDKSKLYFTLVSEKWIVGGARNTPKGFITISIDPANGRAIVNRP